MNMELRSANGIPNVSETVWTTKTKTLHEFRFVPLLKKKTGLSETRERVRRIQEDE